MAGEVQMAGQKCKMCVGRSLSHVYYNVLPNLRPGSSRIHSEQNSLAEPSANFRERYCVLLLLLNQIMPLQRLNKYFQPLLHLLRVLKHILVDSRKTPYRRCHQQ